MLTQNTSTWYGKPDRPPLKTFPYNIWAQLFSKFKIWQIVLKDCRLSLYLGQRTLDMETGFYLLGHSFWKNFRTSLVIQWLRMHLSMQKTWVQSLVQEDTICCRATKPMYHNYWAHALQLPKPTCSRARVLQREKPSQWETRAPQLESSPHLPQLEKSLYSNEDPIQFKKKKKKSSFWKTMTFSRIKTKISHPHLNQ